MSLLSVVEISKGSNYKYELLKGTGELLLDRVLDHHYPFNYGFIPNTLSEDGDPIDVFIISETPIHPLVKVKIEILGVIEMEDSGVMDEKLVCRIENSNHLYDTTFNQILYFLRNYKKGVVIKGIGNKDRAFELLGQAVVRYEKRS